MASKTQESTFGRPLSRNSKPGCASLDSPNQTEPGSLFKAPRGKIPYLAISKIDAGSQAPATPTILADTAIISEKLAEEGVWGDLNAKLSPVEKAHDSAIRALLEDKLYFYQVGVVPYSTAFPPSSAI